MGLFADPKDEERSISTPRHVVALRIFVALFMFAMMAVMFVDVIGRYLFNSSIQGGFEIIAYLLGLLIFCGFPLVTRSEEHITVGLLDAVFHGRAKWIRDLFVLIVSMVAVGFIASRMWHQANLLSQSGEVLQMFDIEIAPFVYVFAALSALSCLLLLVVIWKFLRSGYHGERVEP